MKRREFLRQALAVSVWTGVADVTGLRQSSAEPAREFTLVARPTEVSVAPGRGWRTWTYNGTVPGPEIRVREGDLLRVTLRNELPEPTSVHWHGLPVPNAMDGVAGLTQPPVAPGESFTYEFRATPAGSYFYHSHAGLQLDRGLYGPLVIEPAEARPGAPSADREYVLLLDDWLDITPEEAWAQLRGGGMMGGMMGPSDPMYAGYLLNGATSAQASPLRVARRERVKLRIVNAASATTFRVGLAGHTMVVTDSDGQGVQPVPVDSLVVGMGERYDVLVEANNPGAWPLLAGPVDSTVPGAIAPFVYEGTLHRLVPVTVWPSALVRGRSLRYADLVPEPSGGSAVAGPARTIPLTLGTTMMGGYVWTINGNAYPNADPIGIRAGDTVRLSIVNATMARHPMHLHGHFFRLANGALGSAGPMKDTVLISMMGRADLEFVADNPGRWLFHCHHLYHMEGGMARVFDYT